MSKYEVNAILHPILLFSLYPPFFLLKGTMTNRATFDVVGKSLCSCPCSVSSLILLDIFLFITHLGLSFLPIFFSIFVLFSYYYVKKKKKEKPFFTLYISSSIFQTFVLWHLISYLSFLPFSSLLYTCSFSPFRLLIACWRATLMARSPQPLPQHRVYFICLFVSFLFSCD